MLFLHLINSPTTTTRHLQSTDSHWLVWNDVVKLNIAVLAMSESASSTSSSYSCADMLSTNHRVVFSSFECHQLVKAFLLKYFGIPCTDIDLRVESKHGSHLSDPAATQISSSEPSANSGLTAREQVDWSGLAWRHFLRGSQCYNRTYTRVNIEQCRCPPCLHLCFVGRFFLLQIILFLKHKYLFEYKKSN